MVTTAPLSSHRAEMDIQWGAATDVGKVRRLNEDSYLDVPGAFVVADGMGGHQAGDVASRLTIEAVQVMLSEGLPDVGTIASLVQRANNSVRAHAGSAGQQGMGSTLVGAFVVQNADEESIVIVNVGDSRCYSLVDDLVSQITVDHSLVQELVDAGEIPPEAAATHPERNVVTRAIGIEDVVAGDFFVLPALPFVRLLLCSDGVSGELSADRLGQILATVDDPAEAADALIAAVLEGRAADNATAIVVDVRRTDPPHRSADDELDVTGPRPTVVLPDPEVTAPLSRFPPPSMPLISRVPAAEVEAPSPIAPAEASIIIDDVPR